MIKLEYPIKDNPYKTVKEVLKSHFHMSDRFVLKLKKNNRIFINEQPAFVYSHLEFR